MIAQIDAVRQRHNDGASEAMRALATLAQMTNFAGYDELMTAYMDGIAAVDSAADAAINARAQAEHEAKKAGATITVQGDMIQVGDVTNSENIAIGKDIGQNIGQKDKKKR